MKQMKPQKTQKVPHKRSSKSTAGAFMYGKSKDDIAKENREKLQALLDTKAICDVCGLELRFISDALIPKEVTLKHPKNWRHVNIAKALEIAPPHIIFLREENDSAS